MQPAAGSKQASPAAAPRSKSATRASTEKKLLALAATLAITFLFGTMYLFRGNDLIVSGHAGRGRSDGLLPMPRRGLGNADQQDTTKTAISGSALTNSRVTQLSSSAFTFYYDHAVDCVAAHTSIQRLTSWSLTLPTAVLLCQANPNCTFFSFNVATGELRLCSGRPGTERDGSIKSKEPQATHATPTSSASANSSLLASAAHLLQSHGPKIAAAAYALLPSWAARHPGWLSADRRGCEKFDVAIAAKHAALNMMPYCIHDASHQVHDPIAPGLQLASNGQLLSTLLSHEYEKYLVTGGRHMLCTEERLGLELRQFLGSGEGHTISQGLECRWRVDTSDRMTVDYINEATGRKLFGSYMSHTRQGWLQVEERCLCSNKQSGLVIGPWCPHRDCLWRRSELPGCLFVDEVNQRCLGSLFTHPGHAPGYTKPAGATVPGDTKEDKFPPKKCLCHHSGAREPGFEPDLADQAAAALHGVMSLTFAVNSSCPDECSWVVKTQPEQQQTQEQLIHAQNALGLDELLASTLSLRDSLESPYTATEDRPLTAGTAAAAVRGGEAAPAPARTAAGTNGAATPAGSSRQLQAAALTSKSSSMKPRHQETPPGSFSVTGGPRCLCYDPRSSGLVLMDCVKGGQRCAWRLTLLEEVRQSMLTLGESGTGLRRGHPDPVITPNLIDVFEVHKDRRAHCKTQLEPPIFVPGAVRDVLQNCAAARLCTAVSYNGEDGMALLCRGHYDDGERGPEAAGANGAGGSGSGAGATRRAPWSASGMSGSRGWYFAVKK